MAKEHANTRVEPDTKAQIDRYADETGVGESEAIRRLIRSGLANEGYGVTAAETAGPTAVEQTLTSTVVSTGLIAVGALLVHLVNFAAGYPGEVTATVAIFATLAFGVSYLALRAEREISSNRFTEALRTGLGFRGKAA